MNSILDNRPALKAEVMKIAEVAGYLWTNGWAERNGGNITVNITDFVDDDIRQMPAISEVKAIGITLPYLKGKYFYCKGTGKRMRDLARWPMDNGSVIRILDDCASYVIIADNPVNPTSELPSHLTVHNHLIEKGSNYKATVHTHPIELVAMSHNPLEHDTRDQSLLSTGTGHHSLHPSRQQRTGRRHPQGTRRLRCGAVGEARCLRPGFGCDGCIRPD